MQEQRRTNNYRVNDKIVALEKTTWFHFRLMKTGFLFCCRPSTSWPVVYKSKSDRSFLQGGTIKLSPRKDDMIPFPFNENRSSFFCCRPSTSRQLYTNPNSDRSLLSCLKVTQCSTGEIEDAPLYNSCTLPIQVMTTGPLPTPQNANLIATNNRDVPRVMKTKFRLRLSSLVWFQVRATSCNLTSSKSAWKSTPKCTCIAEECGDPWCNQVASGWPWVWQKDSAPTHKSKETRLSFRNNSMTLYPSLTGPPPPRPEPAGLLRWSYVGNITNMISHNTKSNMITASAEYSPSSRRSLWKRHAPSSGSVSRRGLRLKAATLNRCQFYSIIKLPELIFSIKF